MNWKSITLGTVAGGVITFLADGVLHGVVMAPTYMRLPVFTKTEASPAWFLLINLSICFTMAVLFSRTRASWPSGVKGGVTFGLFVGAVIFFQRFFDPLVFEGFPYYLSWCQGGISMIDAVLAGAALGATIK